MAYDIFSGAVLEVRVMQRLNGQTMMNVRHYQLSSSSTLDGETTIIDAAGTMQIDANDWAWINALYAAQSNQVAYTSLDFQWIFPTRYATLSIVPDATNGFVLDPALPQNVQASVTLRPDEAMRGRIGGARVGGVPTTGVINGELETVYFDSLAVIADKMTNPVILATSGAQLDPILYDKRAVLSPLVLRKGSAQPQSRVLIRRTVGRGI